MQCKDQGCRSKAVRRGYCNMHHLRLKRSAEKGDEKAKMKLEEWSIYSGQKFNRPFPTIAEEPFPTYPKDDGLASYNFPNGTCARVSIKILNECGGVIPPECYRQGTLENLLPERKRLKQQPKDK